MASKFILSTMTNSVNYCFYAEQQVSEDQLRASRGVGPLPVIRKKILVRGGAGIPSLRSGFGDQKQNEEGLPIWTAQGMVTPVSEEDCEALKSHPLFRRHLEAGYVRILLTDLTDNHAGIVREVNRGMTPRDGFAQLSKETVVQRVKVTTEKPKNEDEFRL